MDGDTEDSTVKGFTDGETELINETVLSKVKENVFKR